MKINQQMLQERINSLNKERGKINTHIDLINRWVDDFPSGQLSDISKHDFKVPTCVIYSSGDEWTVSLSESPEKNETVDYLDEGLIVEIAEYFGVGSKQNNSGFGYEESDEPMTHSFFIQSNLRLTHIECLILFRKGPDKGSVNALLIHSGIHAYTGSFYKVFEEIIYNINYSLWDGE